MPVSVPNYIHMAKIQDNSILYAWDDWDDQGEEPLDEDLVARLEGLSQRATLAFMCGTAEWIVHRLARLCDDPAPSDYLETAWAMLVDVRYCGYGSGTWWQEYAMEEWVGPVKGPLGRALDRLEIAMQQLAWEKENPSDRATMLSNLTLYVMTDSAPYRRWREQVLKRLKLLYPRDPEDELGDVVPRQAVDPKFDFKIEQTEFLINEFLSKLDHRSNIFLSSPEGMLEDYDDEDEGFNGTPYIFDIEADRKARRGVL